MINYKKINSLAPVFLRFGLSLVVAWFGFSQVLNPNAWTSLVPSWATGFGLSAHVIVILNGWFEIVASTLLVVGIYSRWVALLLSLHLFVITLDMGLSPVGVRDFGLSFSLLASAMFGQDEYCFDFKEENK